MSATTSSSSRLPEEEPPLLKTESYVRRDKNDKTLIMPRMMTRKRSEAKKSSKKKSRLSFAGVVKSIGDAVGGISSSSSNSSGSTSSLLSCASEENPFAGHWESDHADGVLGFLEELEVSSKYMKLASKYGGSMVQTLFIVQDGDSFEITSNNERRAVTISFTVGTPFYSENERGETTTCSATWENDRSVLVIRAKNVTSKADPDKEILVRRELRGENLFEEMHVTGAKSEKKVTRTYKPVV